jgi:CDP-diacylglycerol--glycerol-3-phosphate 3-phosphatidyltransferase
VIIAREVLISALREWMATRGHREAVAVAFSGKLKTTFQMIAIVALILVTESSPDWLLMTGFVMIYIAALLSLYSALHYLKAARPYLTP